MRAAVVVASVAVFLVAGCGSQSRGGHAGGSSSGAISAAIVKSAFTRQGIVFSTTFNEPRWVEFTSYAVFPKELVTVRVFDSASTARASSGEVTFNGHREMSKQVKNVLVWIGSDISARDRKRVMSALRLLAAEKR